MSQRSISSNRRSIASVEIDAAVLKKGDIQQHEQEHTETSLLLQMNSPTINESTAVPMEYKLYWRRFYILFAFSFITMEQNLIWITYGSIEELAKQYYNTSTGVINFLAATGPIAFFPMCFLAVWIIDKFGARRTMILTAFCCMFGAVVRCIKIEGFGSYNLIFPIIGQVVSNTSGPVCMIMQTKISSLWFAPDERSFATATMTQCSTLGISVAYVVALLIKTPQDVTYMLYGYGVLSILGMLFVLAYFPDKPPSPPSPSGDLSTHLPQKGNSPLTVLKNSWDCCKNRNAMLIIIAGSLSGGFYSAWGAMIVEIVTPLHYTQNEADWFGFYSQLAGAVGGVVFGKVHDLYQHYKILLISLYALQLLDFLWLTATTGGFIPFAFWGSQISNVLGGFLQSAPSAIVYEGIVENTYPISEQTGVNVYAVLFNFWGLVFLACGSYISGSLMNGLLCGAIFGSLLCCIPMQEVYKRKKMDETSQTP